MKIIKRDGRIVEYNRDKIVIAISKANKEVTESERATPKQIDNIIKHIEELNKKRILVEDIQDIIETELMKLKKYELAKKYIIYRYNRALIRKSNITDESILSIIKKSNNNTSDDKKLLLANQNELIASEVSSDLTKRILLPEKICEAIDEGYLYFNNSDSFIHPMINSSIINYANMFNEGYNLNDHFYQKPGSFQEAIHQLIQIINDVYHNQYGGITINFEHLGEYLKLSENNYLDYLKTTKIKKEDINDIVNNEVNKELIDNITYLNNFLDNLASEYKDAKITIVLYLNKDNEYIKYNAKIIEEIINQKYNGINDIFGNNHNNSAKLIYVLEDINIDNGEYAYLTQEVIECIKFREEPLLLSRKMMESYYGNMNFPLDNDMFIKINKNNEGIFNIGVVTLNLVQIAISANKDEDAFINLLDERLELCYEALMHRYHTIMGTNSSLNPLSYNYGALARLDINEKIDSLLKNNNASLSLGLVGLDDAILLMKDVHMNDPIGDKLFNKINKYINKIVNDWKKNTNINFNISVINLSNIGKVFINKDIEKYGYINTIHNKRYYRNIYDDSNDIMDKLEALKRYQEYFLGGYLIRLQTNDINKIISYLYNNITYCRIESEEKNESTSS